MKRIVMLGVSAFLLLSGLSFCHAQTTTFTNPILEHSADPWVVYWNGVYYYTNSSGTKLILRKATDITQLASAPVQVIWTPPPNTAYSQEIWAPELHRWGTSWYMYFAADDGVNDHHHIFVIENDNADPTTGTWTFLGQVTGNGWAIDPTEFAVGGKHYLVWSGWPGSQNGTQNLYIQQLSSPSTLTGTRVLISTPTYPWEKFNNGSPLVVVNEAPEYILHNGTMNISFSASGCWTDHYALGLLQGTEGNDPLDPNTWTKKPNPIFISAPANDAYGPGHNSFFVSPDLTENWIIYHANDSTNQGCGTTRNVRIQPFSWNADNSPDLGKPVAIGAPLSKPSGTP